MALWIRRERMKRSMVGLSMETSGIQVGASSLRAQRGNPCLRQAKVDCRAALAMTGSDVMQSGKVTTQSLKWQAAICCARPGAGKSTGASTLHTAWALGQRG